MNRKLILSKAMVIRAVSFAIILLIALGAFGIYNFISANQMKQTIGYGYEKNFSLLASGMMDIENDLQKLMYSNSPMEVSVLATEIYSKAQSVKECMSCLPMYEKNMANTNSFLSQVSEYCMSLSRKYYSNEKISNEELETIASLCDYAGAISMSVNDLKSEIVDQAATNMGVYMLINGSDKSEDYVSLTDGLKQIENSVSDYKIPAYNGMYSEYQNETDSKFLQSKDEVTKEQAAKIAAKLLGKNEHEVTFSSMLKTKIEAYVFTSNVGSVAITKKGGLLFNMSKYRESMGEKISRKEALEKGAEFLKQAGYKDLHYTNYYVDNNVLSVSFFTKTDAATVYTEIIHTSIALDNGEVLAAECKGYMINRDENRSINTKLSMNEAERRLSKSLKVEEKSVSVISNDAQKEVICYEFICSAGNDSKLAVYINADTGAEERIYFINEDSNGVYYR